jgi:hypothetical protein
MYLEDVTIKRGDTLWNLTKEYAHKPTEWEKVWKHPRNATVVAMRKKPENIQPGDIFHVPIPWKITSETLNNKADGAEMIVIRDGELGKRLTWVQTVYRHNQPIGPNPNPFCVDACTPDDNLPFYWTKQEIKDDPELARKFYDYSRRGNPTAAQGTTKWRAVLSIGVVTEKRVTIYSSRVWGWDLPVIGPANKVGPRAATPFEVSGHLNLLRKGLGTGPHTFTKEGWTFRQAPP